MNARERATKWLIEHNHHGCHVSDLDLPADTPMPLPADVDALAALLELADRALTIEHGKARRYAAALVRIRDDAQTIGQARGMVVSVLRGDPGPSTTGAEG